MAIDDMLTLRAYTTQGELLDEMVFSDIRLNSHEYQEYPMIHQAFVNDNMLNLCLRKAITTKPQDEILISLETDNGIKLKQRIDSLGFGNKHAEHYRVHAKGDRIYIISAARNSADFDDIILEPLIQQHFYIMVYEKDGLLYKGELITDADEDYEIERLKYHPGGFGYDIYSYLLKTIMGLCELNQGEVLIEGRTP